MVATYWKTPFDSKLLERFSDSRGSLFEVLRFREQNIPADGQLYTFSIEPGARRGDHFHLKKEEWFSCVFGEVIVLLTSKIGEDRAIEMGSSRPKIVYVAPGTGHALINRERSPAVIVSYGSHQHNEADPDTFPQVCFPSYR